MLIAQLSDLHIGFHPGHADEPNLRRLRQVLDLLASGPDRPDLLLLSGDLTEHGDDASFAVLAEALTGVPFPVWPIPGNHDSRAGLARAFAQVPQKGGFLHYTIETHGLRIVMLDSLEDGRHAGAFCEARAQWLRDELARDAAMPTLVVIHHPPVPVGLDWMDPGPAEPWIVRLGEALAGHGQVQAILCGHLHRPIVTSFAGIPLAVCPSSAPPLALDLRAIDPARPDGRAMVTGAPPGFALHRWDGQRLTTHFGFADEASVLAAYDAKFQPVIETLLAERS